MNNDNQQYRSKNIATNSHPNETNKSGAMEGMPDPTIGMKEGKNASAKSSSSSLKTKWPQQVKAAKSQWGKLSETEILNSDGDLHQLSTLVQQRYSLAGDVADKQVKSFLDKCKVA
jgi:uncharacterized protein YjbJ (UPF0337 family)